MRIVEYRIVLPTNLPKYKIGSRYMVNDYVKSTQSNGEGIEIVKCEPYTKENESGMYTYKILHFKSKIPKFIRWAVPDKYLHFHEESYNGFPHLYTKEFVPGLGDDFQLSIETQHSDYKKGDEFPENLVNLNEEELKIREIYYIDILNGQPQSENPDEQICNFTCPEAGITKPITEPEKFFDQHSLPKWLDSYDGELMIAVKVVRFNFKWFGLQTAVEKLACDTFYPKLFTDSHRKVIGKMKYWYNMTWEDIRREEDEIANQQKQEGENLFHKDDENQEEQPNDEKKKE